MLSLKSTNRSRATQFRRKKPTTLKTGPVVWIDFTDVRTLYNDAGNTEAGNGESIYRVSNKAFDKRFAKASPNAIGKYCENSTAGNRPVLRLRSKGFAAQFDGTNDYLQASKSQGNVATNKLSDTTLHGTNSTIFVVLKSSDTDPAGQYPFGFGGNESSSNNDPFNLQYALTDDQLNWYTGDRSDKTGDVFTDSGVTNTQNVEMWTIRLTTNGACSMYRNGNTSDGTSTGNSKTMDYDLSGNYNGNLFNIGCGGIGGGFFDGDIYEIIVYDEVLHAFSCAVLDRQLKQKYNL